MASQRVDSAAPYVLARGINDLSTTPPIVEDPGLPTHCPKVYNYAAWGPTSKPVLCAPSMRLQIYGADTFDPLNADGYYNHQSMLSNILAEQANAHALERVYPDDGGPKANFLLSLEVATGLIPVYQRNADGSYLLDNVTGLPMPTSPATTVTGRMARWVVTSITDRADEATFGAATSKAGVLTLGGSQSVSWPMIEFRAKCYGKRGNDAGVRLWAPTDVSNTPANSGLFTATRAYPYRMSVVRRPNGYSSGSVVSTLTGAQYLEFVTKVGAVDPVNPTVGITLPDQLHDAYNNTSNLNAPIVYGDFGEVKVYTANWSALQAAVTLTEKLVTDSDVYADPTAIDLINLLTGTNKSGTPYHTFQVDSQSIKFSETTTLYAQGGSDGTMSNVNFDTAVTASVTRYADEYDPYQDTALYPESHIYDTGFDLNTKKALLNFIAVRKDTAVVLATHIDGEAPLTAAQEYSRASVLKGYAAMFAESDYYGTSTRRAAVVGMSGKVVGRPYRPGQASLVFELARITARCMGASNGVWKSQYVFDVWPATRITMFSDLNVPTISNPQKKAWWSVGVNWAQPYNTIDYHFPAIHTVCDDDTSIFTSWITMCAAVEFQKVGMRIHRQYSGSIRYTEEQFKSVINSAVSKALSGRFAGLFTIVPNCQITAADQQRGYSWTLGITLGAENARTVMVLSVDGVRASTITNA